MFELGLEFASNPYIESEKEKWVLHDLVRLRTDSDRQMAGRTDQNQWSRNIHLCLPFVQHWNHSEQ